MSLSGLHQLTTAQRAQQIAREDHALAASLGQPASGREVDPLLQRVLDLADKAQITKSPPPPINC
ncbi:hypothetical protein GCM10023165_10110 [Variovorax defluvii]|uniref:Uncharacterized protein n=1 Tax=Variovorax defluvii TaxID=913761 RepID=A0ABP8H4Q7_9BURK